MSTDVFAFLAIAKLGCLALILEITLWLSVNFGVEDGEWYGDRALSK
jgi:hypothetical protein